MIKWYSKFAQVAKNADDQDVLLGLIFLDFLYTGKYMTCTVPNNLQAGRLDLISWLKINSDPSQWRLIAWMNGIIDPISEITVGKELLLPVTVINTLNEIVANTYPGVSTDAS